VVGCERLNRKAKLHWPQFPRAHHATELAL
jgi:hypothetical protein